MSLGRTSSVNAEEEWGENVGEWEEWNVKVEDEEQDWERKGGGVMRRWRPYSSPQL